MDHLVYEVSGVLGHTTDVSDLPDGYRPLFGCCGTDTDCDVMISEYINRNQTYTHEPCVLTVYLISCLDPSVTETYVGQTWNFPTRVSQHSASSLVESTKVHLFIRFHGGWGNWQMKPLGVYNCRRVGDADRMEWYWWNKTGSTLNSVIPGKGYVTSLESVEQLEKKLSGPPTHFKNRRPTLTFHHVPCDKEVEFVECHVDIRGCLFHVTREGVPESYIGFTIKPYSRSEVSRILRGTKENKRAHLFMTLKGGFRNWKSYPISHTCSYKDYKFLSDYFALNHLTQDELETLLS
jgi:hypothetical protein